MQNSMHLRIAAVFILFVASFVGIVLPMVFGKNQLYRQMLLPLQTCAAGVMLSLSMIHLSPEAVESLYEVVPDYPLGFALIGVGVILVLTVEQCVQVYSFYLKQRSPAESCCNGDRVLPSVPFENSSIQLSAKSEVHVEHDENCGFVKCTHVHTHHENQQPHDVECAVIKPAPYSYQSNIDAFHPSHEHGHSGPCSSSCISNNNNNNMNKITNINNNNGAVSKVIAPTSTTTHDNDLALYELRHATSIQDLLMVYALELSTAVHSIIIGVNLGLLGDSEYSTLTVLLVALCFHQFVEGVGVGAVIESNRKALGLTKITVFVLIFSCTISLGVVIGILSSSEATTVPAQTTKAVATAIASGALLYSSLVEMTGKFFNEEELQQKPLTRLAMLTTFVLGYGVMALIGVWA